MWQASVSQFASTLTLVNGTYGTKMQHCCLTFKKDLLEQNLYERLVIFPLLYFKVIFSFQLLPSVVVATAS